MGAKISDGLDGRSRSVRAMVSTHQQQVESNGAKIRHVVPPESSSPWRSGAGTPHRAVEVAHQPEKPSSARGMEGCRGVLAKQPSSQVRQPRSGVGRQGNIPSEAACRGHQARLSVHLGACRLGLTRAVSGADRMGAETGTEILDSWLRSIPELGACPPGAPRQLSLAPVHGATVVPPLHAMPSHLFVGRSGRGRRACWGSAACGRTQTGSVLCTERGGRRGPILSAPE